LTVGIHQRLEEDVFGENAAERSAGPGDLSWGTRPAQQKLLSGFCSGRPDDEFLKTHQHSRERGRRLVLLVEIEILCVASDPFFNPLVLSLPDVPTKLVQGAPLSLVGGAGALPSGKLVVVITIVVGDVVVMAFDAGDLLVVLALMSPLAVSLVLGNGLDLEDIGGVVDYWGIVGGNECR